MTPAEQNYNIGDRELLAVKLALEEWRHWLEGTPEPFTVFTDHKNLEYLKTAKRLNARQARWAMFFTRFNFVLSYRPGSKNGKADALSRYQVLPECEMEPDYILPASARLAIMNTDIEEELGRALQGRLWLSAPVVLLPGAGCFSSFCRCLFSSVPLHVEKGKAGTSPHCFRLQVIRRQETFSCPPICRGPAGVAVYCRPPFTSGEPQAGSSVCGALPHYQGGQSGGGETKTPQDSSYPSDLPCFPGEALRSK
ncbi:uncharacterized protein LOC118598406 [Oryzias melastigma]|uniref:uncharacterized protein LOC118598406 n=1 Tax=Oryzias melastigma TaxID=30732 RepID=UPI00168D697E|nr:uncharacterized protein LOC118598406 [Oryzias melastigma]